MYQQLTASFLPGTWRLALSVQMILNYPFLTLIFSRADRCIHLNDHGQLCGQQTGKEAAVLAVVVTVAKGYDLGYIWKTQDRAAGRGIGGYYINAARAGESPGRWWGPGARALGFTTGQIVERTPYDAVYRQVDPRTGDRLGRAGGEVPGDLAPGEPGGAGVPASVGRGDPHRLPRCPGR